MTGIDKPNPPRAGFFMRDDAVPWRTLGPTLGYVVLGMEIIFKFMGGLWL